MTEGNRPTRIGNLLSDTTADFAARNSTVVADFARSSGAMEAIAKLEQTVSATALDAIRSAGALPDLDCMSGVMGVVREAGASAAKAASLGTAIEQMAKAGAWQDAADNARFTVERALAELPGRDYLEAFRSEPIDFVVPPMPVNPVPGQTLDELRAVRVAMEAQVAETKAARAAQQRAEDRTRAVQEAADKRARRHFWVGTAVTSFVGLVGAGLGSLVTVLLGG